jgi:hypothetical protein
LLYYYTKDNRLVITEKDPNSEDFKSVLEESLIS